ncbi:unnamed protein product [Cylicostephanus goldi]|uniref:Uncharacterized protein n=1 Tax=Cylicostephanus goldi TaxID=71465 RepID=A0A3P6RZ63_CYLGO|nr:unnamed protein product [Cylicostephanus goldi]
MFVKQKNVFSEEGKKGKINEYLVLAGIIGAVVAVLFLFCIVCLQRLREKKRRLKLAEIKHRKETVKTSTGTEEKKDGQKLSAEALQSKSTPDEVTPARAAASPPTATSGNYVNAADLTLDILTASTQSEEDIQS